MAVSTPCPRCGALGIADGSRCPACKKPDPYIGTVLLGKYQCHERIGGDAGSSHYRATHVKLDRARSLHILRGDLRSKPEAVEAFYAEGRLLASMRMESAGLLHDVDTLEDASPCSVWDLATGTSLADRVADGPLGAHAASVTRGLCAVLDALHARSIAHLDLCPDNVLLLDGITPPMPYLFGFYEARTFGSAASRSISDPRVGFAAPEQLADGATVDGRADVFALGALIAYIMTGQKILATPDLRTYTYELKNLEPARLKVLAQLPAALRTIVARCLDRHPENRPANASEVREAIRRTAREEAQASVADDITNDAPHRPARDLPSTVEMVAARAPNDGDLATNAWLEPVAGDTRGPMQLPSDALIGRAPECGIILDHPTVSKRHAHIRRVRGEYVITDLGSRNGSSVNGRRVRDATSLTSGDTVVLGDVVFRFRIEGTDNRVSGLSSSGPAEQG